MNPVTQVNTQMAVDFLTWWFKPTDIIQLEPLVSREPTAEDKRRMIPATQHRRYEQFSTNVNPMGEANWVLWNREQIDGRMQSWLNSTAAVKAHAFYGCAPRELPDRKADMLHQIRRIPGCWADFDHLTPEQVIARIAAVGLPEPSRLIMSGGGCHAYWKFEQEYIIDDAGPIDPVFYDKPPGEAWRKPYVLVNGEKEWLGKRKIPPSIKTQAFIDVQAGLYTLLTDEKANFRADSVQNPNRFLRVPGSINPKYDRLVETIGAGTTPVTFAMLNELTAALQPKRREMEELVPAPKSKKWSGLTAKRRDRIAQLAMELHHTEVGTRSDKAFELVCLCYEMGLSYDETLGICMKVQVFTEKGEKWFDRTWEAALKKHREDYLDKFERAKAQVLDREGLGPVPTGVDAVVVAPQQQPNSAQAMWENTRIARGLDMCRDMRFTVVGEKVDGGIVIYSQDLKKTTEIKDINRVGIPRLNQAIGTAAAARLTNFATDAPSQYAISEARELIGLLGGKYQITNDTYVGTGIWPVRDNKVLTGEVVLINGADSAVYDPRSNVLSRLTSPRYKDVVMSLEGQIESPWYTFDELQTALQAAADPANRQWLANRLLEHFAQWRWSDAAMSPSLLTGLVLSAFVQTCWPWRPLVAIMGAAGSGKTLLMQQLQDTFGPLAFGATHATEAAVRQGMGNQAKVIFSDEFEASARRGALYELLRTSSRGDFVIRGSSGHRMQKFGLKHIPFLASIELGLEREPDRSRFIILDLERSPSQIALMDPAQAAKARLACLGAALHCLPQALHLAGVIATAHATEGCDRRLIDNLSVPVAMGLAVQGIGEEQAKQVFGNILRAKATEGEDTDDQALLGEILSLLVDLGSGQKRTVAEMLSTDSVSLDASVDALARQYGISIVSNNRHQGPARKPSQIPREEQWLFIAGGKVKSSNGLRFSRFSDQNPNELLKRVCPIAELGRVRVSNLQQRGVLMPMSWVRQHFMGEST